MKPSWNDAPEWAKWLAMDKDGFWYWYEKSPFTGEKAWWAEGGKCEKAGEPNTDDWTNTLAMRP